MKTKIYLSLIIAFLGFYSCNKSDDEDNDMEQLDPTADAFNGEIAFSTTDNPEYPYVVATNEESVILIGTENQEGSRELVFSEEQGNYFLTVNSLGIPEKAVFGDYIMIFDNYDGGLIDMAIIGPDESIDLRRGIDVSSTSGRIEQLQALSDSDVTNALSAAGTGVSLLGCALSFASLAGGPLPAGIIIPVACGAAALSTLNLITEGDIELLNASSTAIGIFAGALGCGVGDPVSCVGLIIDTLTPIVDASNNHIEENQDIVDLGEGALESGDGDIKVTLTWDNTADLDLYVTDPFGETIYYSNSTSESGGVLDFDDTDGFGPENIFWENGASGNYVVEVDHYSGESPANFQVLVRILGEITTFNGSISDGEKITITNFSAGRALENWTMKKTISDKPNVK